MKNKSIPQKIKLLLIISFGKALIFPKRKLIFQKHRNKIMIVYLLKRNSMDSFGIDSCRFMIITKLVKINCQKMKKRSRKILNSLNLTLMERTLFNRNFELILNIVNTNYLEKWLLMISDGRF